MPAAAAAPQILRHDSTEPWSCRSLAAVVEEHAVELTHMRRLLTINGTGENHDSRWLQELDFFIAEIIEPQVGVAAVGIFGRAGFRRAVDAVTSRYLQSRVAFNVENDLSPFEHRVTEALESLGWKVDLTNGPGVRHLDVIARMREKSLLIHCRYSSSRVPAAVVPDVYADMVRNGFDYAAIVSNAQFCPGAKRHAKCTRTILLHHDELNQLEECIFGTDTWRSHFPKLSRR